MLSCVREAHFLRVVENTDGLCACSTPARCERMVAGEALFDLCFSIEKWGEQSFSLTQVTAPTVGAVESV